MAHRGENRKKERYNMKELTLTRYIIFITTLLIALVGYGIHCEKQVTIAAFQNGYEQRTLPGSIFRGWMRTNTYQNIQLTK